MLFSGFLFVLFLISLSNQNGPYKVLCISFNNRLITTVGKHCRQLQKPLLLHWLLNISVGKPPQGRYTFL